MANFAMMNKCVPFILTITMLMATSLPASGESAEPDTLKSLREVSVTAIKTGSDMPHGPVAATVVGRSEIERLNISTIKGISEIAPNFYMPAYGSPMTSSIYVRGLGARIDQPVVGLNVDNVPFLNKDAFDFELSDIERIEVMRGPQTILYGRNTMAGLINVYTLSPLHRQGLSAMVEYATHNSFKASATALARIADPVAMSLTTGYTHTDGYFRNKYDNSHTGLTNSGSVRWKTIATPSASVTIDNIAALNLCRQDGYPYENTISGEISYNDPCFYKRTTVSDGLTVTWQADKFKLSSITSWQYINDNMTLDQDFLPESYFVLTQRRHENALTQDIVINGKKDCWEWLGGAFLFYKDAVMSAPVTFKETGIQELIVDHRNEANLDYPINWNESSFPLSSDFDPSTFGLAAYHRSRLNLGDFTLECGLRLDYENSNLYYRSRCNTFFTVNDFTGANGPEPLYTRQIDINDHGTLSSSFLQLIPKLSLTYRPAHDVSVWASIAKGYKAGGFNTQMFSDVLQQQLMSEMGLSMAYDIDEIVSYKPETSWNYELGIKLNMPDNRLTADFTAFYIDCRDQQLTMFPYGTTTGRIMTNAGKTRSFGCELTARYSPLRELALSASYGFTNARFVVFDDGRQDYSGHQVPYAPSNTLWLSAAYTIRLKSQSPMLQSVRLALDCRGVGRIYWDEANEHSQPFYLLPGASATLAGNKYSFELWASNFTSTRYDVFSFMSMGNRFTQRGTPFCFGATLRMNLNTNFGIH